MTKPDQQKLDELENEINDARRQAEGHGTITGDEPDPTYKAGPGGPVGIPVDEENDDDESSPS